jgi:hypothetical protein
VVSLLANDQGRLFTALVFPRKPFQIFAISNVHVRNLLAFYANDGLPQESA